LRAEIVELERELGLGRERGERGTRSSARAEMRSEPPGELICFVGPEGEIRFAFSAAGEFLGWGASDLLGRQVADLVHPEEAPSSERWPEQAGLRHRMRKAGGGFRWVESRCRPLQESGGRLCVTRDVHQEELARRRAMEAERRGLELERLARTDVLTGLANRRQAQEVLARETRRADRHGFPLSVVLLDIDHFKSINDRFGHPQGDGVLARVAASLRSTLREEDMVARWGGEEFLVVLPHVRLESALVCTERLRARSPLVSEVGQVTLSAGVAELGEGEGCHSLIDRADRALYRAKARGRDQAVLAS
jgi:diguanylate cyclase (GGDEF)-like protein/PAS domain S-box-containing protein